MIKFTLLGISVIGGGVVIGILLIYFFGLLKIWIINTFTKNTILYKTSAIMHHGSTVFLLAIMGILVLGICFFIGFICFGR
jgi:hypothetical protein